MQSIAGFGLILALEELGIVLISFLFTQKKQNHARLQRKNFKN